MRAPESNNFDALRLAMALLVVWSHSFRLHLGTDDTEWVNRLTGGLYSGGTIAVLVFFTISGFLVTQSYDRSRTPIAYLEKRVRRIYPGYMVATSICAFVVIPLFSAHPHLSLSGALRTTSLNLRLLDLPPSDAFTMNPDHRVNGSLWTIPFEFGCYLGVLLIGAKRGYSLIALFAAVLIVHLGMDLLVHQPATGLTKIAYLSTMLLPSFLVGIVAYSYRDRLPRSRVILISSLVAAVVACRLDGPSANLVVVPAVGYATFYFAFSDRVRLQHFGRMGDFSYGTYLYAFPIQQMVQARFGREMGLASYIVVSILLSLIAGVASWHLVEKHFLHRRREVRAALAVTAR